MIAQIVTVVVLLALAAFFAWLATRVWRARSLLVRLPGTLVLALLTLLFGAVGVVAAIGTYNLNRTYAYPVSDVKIAGTPDQLAKGQKFANLCIGCHSTGQKLPLDGSGEAFLPPPFGTLYAPNLTPGGPLRDWSDGEIIRAIREGVDKDGKALIIMPSEVGHNFSDADVQSLVAYLRSQPAVQREVPERNLSPVAAILVGAGMFPTSVQPPITQPVVAPPAAVNAQFGAYALSIAGCRDCHGKDLKGRAGGGNGPPGGPLISNIGKRWDSAGFVRMMRTGVTPDGKELNEEMPWKEYNAAFSDDELRAIFEYLKTLP